MGGKGSSRHCLTMLFISGVLLAGGCQQRDMPLFDPEDGTSATPQPVLKVEPLSLRFDAGGGRSALFITAGEADEWSADADAEWVEVIENQGSGSTELSVAARANDSAEPRYACVTVTSPHASTISVTIEQAAAPAPSSETILLKEAVAHYRGDLLQTNGELDNVRLELRGTDPSSSDYPIVEIVLDLNIPATTFAATDLTGSYAANLTDIPCKGSFNSSEATCIIRQNADGDALEPLYTVGGDVAIVRSNDLYRIDLTLKTGDGTTCTARYEGPIILVDDTAAPHSTLTEDVRPNVLRATGMFYPCDDPQITARKLVLQFYGDLAVLPLENMMWTLLVEPEAAKNGAIEGRYSVIGKPSAALTAEDLQVGGILAGEISTDDTDTGIFSGSWYRLLTTRNGETELMAAAPLVKGEAVVSRDGKSYTIDYLFVDDNVHSPHTVSGQYKGSIDFQNLDE